jgi:hypothetical protein
VLDVISAIKEYGFEASPYPVILSIENHCSLPQQQRLSKIMKDILKEMLGNFPSLDIILMFVGFLITRP